MLENLSIFSRIFVSIFTIMGPFIAIPTLIGMTPKIGTDGTKLIARRAVIVAFFILLASSFIGFRLFGIFGISLASFRIAGGILIAIMGVDMLHSQKTGVKFTEEELKDAKAQEDISVSPLAIPMIAGPGAISTVILYSSHPAEYSMSHFKLMIILISAILLSCISLYILLRYSRILYKTLGKSGVNIITRIMGLIIMANGIEFVISGIKDGFNL